MRPSSRRCPLARAIRWLISTQALAERDHAVAERDVLEAERDFYLSKLRAIEHRVQTRSAGESAADGVGLNVVVPLRCIFEADFDQVRRGRASPRLATTEYPRRSRGVAATRLL